MLNLEKIEALIRPLIENSGFTLYDVEFQGRVLRVCIDKPGGVSLEDCVETSRLLNPLLDVEDIVPGGRYELEVSSPGLNRRLKKQEHFTGAIGEMIYVTTSRPLDEPMEAKVKEGETEPRNVARRNFKGILKECDSANIKLVGEGEEEILIPFSLITKASVDFELKTTPKPGRGKTHGAP